MHVPRGEKIYFLDPNMRLIPDAPPPPPPLPARPVEALISQNRARGVEPAYDTGAARYKRDDDVPWSVVARAMEALERDALEHDAAAAEAA